MAVVNHTNQPLRSSKKIRDSTFNPCGHSSIRNSNSSMPSLPHTHTRRPRQATNNYGEDADQFLLRRRDSTGTELILKHRLSRSSSSGFSEIVARRRATLPYRVQSNLQSRPLTYYPLHQGPHITVSSGDGTTLYADSESDNQCNAAAQSLYRALQRQQSSNKLKTIDGHLDRILGAVDVDVSIKETTSLQKVHILENGWEVQSDRGFIECEKRGKRRWWAKSMGRRWNAWATRMSGLLR